MALSRGERLAKFLSRLRVAQPVATHDAAFDLLSRTLNEVEDEYSGVPFDPSQHLSDGRMYPPESDARRQVPDRPDLVRYRSRGHDTYIAANGAIRIQTCKDPITVCLNKPGADGQLLELPDD